MAFSGIRATLTESTPLVNESRHSHRETLNRKQVFSLLNLKQKT